jgi:dTDP-4-dehydrorhamnose reductase
VKVLITGASGQVGQALLAAAPAELEITATTREQLDISDGQAVRALVARVRPDVIINAAAYTAVDRAESEPDLATAVNAAGPGHLAEAALRIPRCRLLHISTDYVFNGRADRPYRPDDEPDPLCVYGRSKLEGEKAVLAVLPERAAVLRTAWVYAPRGRNFVLTMLRLMRERASVRVVADQKGAPTAALSIASALYCLASQPSLNGVFHWTDAGSATWYDFACAIAEEGARLELTNGPVTVTPITTAEYPTAAHRPANSVLDLSGSIARLGMTPLPWRERLCSTLQQMSRDG